MRIITVDNGNTNPHVGIFQDETLVKIIPLKDYTYSSDDFIIASDVGKSLPFKPSLDLKALRIKAASGFIFFNMPVHYAETLGDDRLVSAFALFQQLKPTEKILVVDAGTFITMDLIDKSGFLGGTIFPGVQTFLSSYQKGNHLPLLKIEPEKESTNLPRSTEEAIRSAADIYLESVLESVIKKTSPSKIVITGGSSELVEAKILKLNLPKVQLEMNRHLIHSSLFLIYQYHLRSK